MYGDAMVSRHTPVFDYLPHSVRHEIVREELARISQGYTVTITRLMKTYTINEAAAKSLLDKIMEERNASRD